MSDKSSDSTKSPLQWIQLELIPLPHLSDEPRLLLWWNPENRELRGDGTEKIMAMVDLALADGKVENAGSVYEITDPLGVPSQLAVILAKVYWVVPEPVRAPHETPSDDDAPKPRLQ
ncbi:hypothetical protein THMIRHAS_19020 [Thiosulfatimonas sediminis]|uniref:Uncharacterized protein n=1 Tax=Thiosulfatimonas sediminis TaxID=2675054 RepID=A0A6F8PWN5_9GAMM|nr:hypothetical protein [Thiosulfatimonas sediminis]BBP46529.1 hypothetical protein THMIRHAS_19020 [Thiosulfatimonas sediminis]